MTSQTSQTSQTPDINTDTDTDDEIDPIAALLDEATAGGIPPQIEAYLATQVAYFASHTNRAVRTLNLTNPKFDSLSKVIVSAKPTSANLAGTDLRTTAARMFADMVRQYATDHNLSSQPKRDGSQVTFRFAAKRAAKTSEPVTVTTVTPTPAAK